MPSCISPQIKSYYYVGVDDIVFNKVMMIDVIVVNVRDSCMDWLLCLCCVGFFVRVYYNL